MDDETPTRTILIHLNIEVPAETEGTGDEIGDAVLAMVEQGLGLELGALASDNVARLPVSTAFPFGGEVCCPLAEEV